MKKKKDAALEYMLQLGITPAKSASGAREQIRRVMDLDALTRLLESDETDRDPGAFYRFKNQTLEAGLTFSGAFSGEILRKMCAEIDGHPECFRSREEKDEGGSSVRPEIPEAGCGIAGPKLLEVGCDCGIVTCFLAKRFPEASVRGLDRCPESIAAAKELAARLKLANAEFVTGTPEELLAEAPEGALSGTAGNRAGGFDTVVSLRTMHENCPVEDEENLTPEEYEQACAEALRDYAGALADLLVPGGVLFTAERSDPEEPIRAWQTALAGAGLSVRPESRKDLPCSEAGVPSLLALVIAEKE